MSFCWKGELGITDFAGSLPGVGKQVDCHQSWSLTSPLWSPLAWLDSVVPQGEKLLPPPPPPPESVWITMPPAHHQHHHHLTPFKHTFHISYEMKMGDPHIPQYLVLLLVLPASLSEVEGILHSSFFNVLRKSCGEITQARSPPFVTDGKPFQRDYNPLDLLSFPFLLKPRYQWSVSCALDRLDSGAHVLARPSSADEILCYDLSISVIHNSQATQWDSGDILNAPCWALLLRWPQPKEVFIMSKSQLPLTLWGWNDRPIML